MSEKSRGRRDSSGGPEARNPVVRDFIEGLERLERERDESALLKLFSDGSALVNELFKEPLRGVEGARRFWHDYRQSFDRIESRFARIREAGDIAVLEWTSSGTLRTGQPIEYRGVSILTLDGDRISDFVAYFDSRHLVIH